MKKKFLNLGLAALITCLTTVVHAQTVTRTEEYFSGSTKVSSFFNGSQVVFASSENDKKVKVIASSTEMKKNWEQMLEGALLFAGNLDNKVLVVVSTDFAAMVGGSNSTYKAYLLNGADGKKISEKLIYTGNDEYMTIPKIELSKDHKSLVLYARETSIKRNVKVAPGAVGVLLLNKKMSNESNKIRSFSVTTYNENLEILDKVIPALPEGDFVDAVKSLDNELYVAVADNKKGVSIARYEAGKEKAASTVLEPFSHGKGLLGTDGLNDYISLQADTSRKKVVYLRGAFKNDDTYICVFNKYDFASNNHKSFIKPFKKGDFKALEKAFVPINKDYKSLDLGTATGVELLDVFQSGNNYLLAVGDLHRSNPAPGSRLPATFTANGILLYMLDENLQEKSVAAVPRYCDQIIKPQFQAYYRNNYWYLLASEEFKARFSVSKFNPANGKVEDIKVIEPEKAGKGDLAFLDNMLITKDQFILPTGDLKMSFSAKMKYDVNLYQIKL